MSKRAEEKAVEYQIKTHGPNVMGGASMLSEEEYMRFNMNLDFKNGYEQAGKDLAITAEDVGCIYHLCGQFNNDFARVADIFNKDREEEK